MFYYCYATKDDRAVNLINQFDRRSVNTDFSGKKYFCSFSCRKIKLEYSVLKINYTLVNIEKCPAILPHAILHRPLTVQFLHTNLHNACSNILHITVLFFVGQQKQIHRIESLTRNMLKTAHSAGAGSSASSNHTRSQHAHWCWKTEFAENHRESFKTTFSYGLLHETTWSSHVRGQHSKNDSQHR